MVHPLAFDAQRNRPKPVLRWAGSKRLMLPKLLASAPEQFERYIEPFCGSACFFLALNTSKSILADLNPHLISTYKQIKEDPRRVAKVLTTWKGTRKEYLQLRSEVPTQAATAAARFLFLNRYSFNGVYRENKKGAFNVPFGGNKNGQPPSLEDLEAFAKSLANTKLVCSDFEDVISEARTGDFLYLDPPYHYGVARNRGEYGYGAFGSDDLGRFTRAVKAAGKRGANILISYNRAHTLKKSLSNWNLTYATTRRSVAGFAQSRRSVREYLLKNY